MINASLPSELQLNEYAKTCPFWGGVPEFYTSEDRNNFYGKEAFTKYPFYWAYTNYFKPQSIVEIGVRNGYSLISMALGNSEKILIFTGKDNEQHHIVKTPYVLAVDNAEEATFFNVEKWESEYGLLGLHLFEGDSKNIASLNVGFDLAHVDGNHTKEYCLNDLNLCWNSLNPGGILIVDDYIAVSIVKESVDQFYLNLDPITVKEHSIYSGIYGGHFLIKKSEGVISNER